MEHLAPRLLDAVRQHGYVIVLLIMIVEEAGVPSPIPGDGLVLFTGYLVSTGALSLTGSLLVVVGGALAGATILYWVSLRGGRPLIERYGRLLRIDGRRLDQLRRLFESLGSAGPGVARLVPGLRIYTSMLAGLAEVSYPLFLLNVLWAATVWALTFLLLGMYAGAHWREYVRLWERGTILVLIAAGLALAAYAWLHFRVRRI